MTRPLKYRMLNIATKQWFYFALADKTGNISVQLVQLDDSIWAQPEDTTMQYTALTEFTGLYDKNGAEIYDGDYFEVWGIRAQIHYSVNLGGWFHGSDRLIYADASKGEVIGNIWKTPELLKGSA